MKKKTQKRRKRAAAGGSRTLGRVQRKNSLHKSARRQSRIHRTPMKMKRRRELKRSKVIRNLKISRARGSMAT